LLLTRGAARCPTAFDYIRRDSTPSFRGLGVKGNDASSSSLTQLTPCSHSLPPCASRSFHSFHSLFFSMKHRQLLCKTSEWTVGPFSVPPTNPVTRSFKNGLGACVNATFVWVDDNPHERPPFHIRVLRALFLNKSQ
jgi:hypothetical protein